MRELVTTVLDLAGLLLLVAAAATLTSRVDPSLGLAVAGGGLLVVSWLGDVMARRAAARVNRRRR